MWKQETPSVSSTPHERRRRLRLAAYACAIVAIAGMTGAMSELARANAMRAESRYVDLRAVPDSVLRRPRVVVLEVDRDELNEIIAHPGQRGRHWERVGRIAFLSDGRLTFESPVGVRVHGGSSRYLPVKSLRLFFRPSLGATRPTSAEVGLEGDATYETLILHGDVRPDTGGMEFHYANPVSYAIAQRLGISTAATVPSSVVINGGQPLPYVTSEQLNPALLRARLGSDSAIIYNLRDVRDKERLRTEGPLAELHERFGQTSTWTMEQVGEVVDVENLINWFLSVVFCGTRDIAQGTLVHDPARAGAQWFWIGWDYDMSFGRLDDPGGGRAEDFHMKWLFSPVRAPDPDARAVILRHLFRTSASFRERFARRFVVARDSLVTARFLDGTLSTFERAATDNGITDRRYQMVMRDFLTRRSAVLTRQLQAQLSTDLP